MNWLPIGTPLGDLVLDETFVFYDGPRIFTARSITDQLYLALWADEGEDADTWLYVPVSGTRVDMLRSGGLPLRVAFKNPEGIIYRVRLPHSTETDDSAVAISVASIEDDLLPAENFRLNILTHTLPLAETDEQIAFKSRQENRIRLRLKVKLPGVTRSEAPSRKIANLLLATQSVYDNIGLAMLENSPSERGPVPERIARKMQSEFVGLTAASFVVELAATEGDDLFGESSFGDVTERLLSLLDTSLGYESLIEDLHQLKSRGAKGFRNFVDALVAVEGDVHIIGAGTSIGLITRELSVQNLRNLSHLLHKLVPDTKIEIRGRMRLFKVNMNRKQFGLIDESDEDESYEGIISPRALAQVDHNMINGLYDVIIWAIVSFDDVINERRPKYTLEQLIVADGSNYVTTKIELPPEAS